MKGKIVKLKIIACKDASYEKETGKTFDALANPTGYTEAVKVQYADNQPAGSSATEPVFEKIKPKQLELNILFDGTGVIPGPNSQKAVLDQIESFKGVCLQYEGNTHMTNYLKVLWGGLLFKGRLTSLSIRYTLFKADGTPLRANGTAVFTGSIDVKLRKAMENNSSPDLSHSRIVKSGDSLPLLSYEIYGTPNYYAEVARKNKLPNFRKIPPGTPILFHPLKVKNDATNS